MLPHVFMILGILWEELKAFDRKTQFRYFFAIRGEQTFSADYIRIPRAYYTRFIRLRNWTLFPRELFF